MAKSLVSCFFDSRCSKKLYFGFVDLEKAFDRVPREVTSWAMHKLGVEEWLVSAVMSMYTGCLLYTSPSPRDRQKSRMPSSA